VTDAEALASLGRSLEDVSAFGVELCLSDDNGRTGDLIGLGLAWSVSDSAYIPVGHRYIGAPEQLGLADVCDFMRAFLEGERVEVRTDDLKKSALYWARQGVQMRPGGFDTGLASYLLHAERRDHGLRAVSREELDTELDEYKSIVDKKAQLDSAEVPAASNLVGARARAAFQLREIQVPALERDGLSALYNDVEVPLAFALAAIEARGICLDVEMLQALSRAVGEAIARLEARCHELAGHPFNVASPRQLETILFDELELPVIKRTKTARSTNQEVLEELSAQHELPQTILEHRGLAKLRNTYLDALPAAVDRSSQRVHSRFNQTVAQTGRLSSSDPNLQNIPIRTELGRRVRDAFIPREGWLLMAADYSQIELRVLAHLSGDEALLEAYRGGLDVHARTAAALFGVPEDEVDRGMRNQGKTVNFAVIYGQTQFALARNLGISRPEAKRYIDAFFARYAGVRDYMAELIESAKRDGVVTTIMGRRRRLPELSSRNHNIRQAGERMARNTPIQGSAADIIKRAMVDVEAEIARAGLRSQMLLTVHDELVFEAPPEEREALDKLVRASMASACDMQVPLVVDVGWGAHWGEAH